MLAPLPFENFIVHFLIIECSLQSGDFLIERHSLEKLMARSQKAMDLILRSMPLPVADDSRAHLHREQYIGDRMRFAAWQIRTSLDQSSEPIVDRKRRFDEAAVRKALILGGDFMKLPTDPTFWLNESWKKTNTFPMRPTAPSRPIAWDRPLERVIFRSNPAMQNAS
jgi:hypothetical protein